MRKAMDYVFTVDNEEILIEGLQKAYNRDIRERS